MFDLLCLCLLLLSFVFVVSLIQKCNEPIVFTNNVGTAVQKAIDDISDNMNTTITDISGNFNIILNKLNT
tara:strand:- start:2354 stop:2563 length:210 start_codon:yes stop_codon:yes gene_type:complete